MSHSHSPVAARKRLLTVEEVADVLQVPKSWVYERTRRRGLEQLPHLKVGKYLRFEECTVREFLERLKVGVATNA
jgi:excisionase family DNA binding protein